MARNIIYDCKRRLEKGREEKMVEVLHHNYDQHQWLDECVKKELEGREIAYELEKSVGRYKIYKSQVIHMKFELYEDEEIICLIGAVVHPYKYEIDDMLYGLDYSLDGASATEWEK